MAAIRFKALEHAYNRHPNSYEPPKALISEYFGINVFDKKKMKKYLPEEAYEHVIEAIEKGIRIDRKIADQIASGMKAWAIEMGATHYTHWFQPLTEGTAEKHDTFIDFNPDGTVIEYIFRQSCLPSRSLMPPVSPAAVSGIPLKPGVILHGIRHLLHLLLAIP